MIPRMSLAIDLPPEAERRLREQAADRHVEPSELATELVQEALSRADGRSMPIGTPNPNQSTLDMLARWAEEDSLDGPSDPAEAVREWEEFRDAMNAHSTRGYPAYP